MRNLLHKSDKDKFKSFLIHEKYVIENPKGVYEAIRARKDKKLFIAYDRDDAKEHYTVQDNMCPIVRKFIKWKRGEIRL